MKGVLPKFHLIDGRLKMANFYILYKVTVCIGETELSIDFTHVREIL